MTDRERVIRGLKCCLSTDLNDCTPMRCSYFKFCGGHGAPNEMLRDALTQLKAQEPRVMTLEEVKQHNNQDGCVWFEQPTYNAVAAFVRKEDFVIEVISPYILGEPINHGEWLNNNYNITWRCWTSRPTDEQREKEPWNGYTDVT